MKPQNYPLKRMQATHVRPARPDLSVAITHIVPTKGKKLSNFLDNLPGIILGELGEWKINSRASWYCQRQKKRGTIEDKCDCHLFQKLKKKLTGLTKLHQMNGSF